MRRREFAGLLGGLAAWPLVVGAQQPAKLKRIGYLSFGLRNPNDEAFLNGLREYGWIEEKNLVVEWRFAGGDNDKLKAFAAEFERLKLDVVVTSTSIATHPVQDVTKAIPIVFVAAADPIGQGFVRSLSHPGGNITGISFDVTPDITAKQIQLLIEMVPGVDRVAVLWNPASAFLRSYWEAAKARAPSLGVALDSFEVEEPRQFESMFDAMKIAHAGALIVLSDTFATFHRSRLVELAAKYRIPTIYGHSLYIEQAGGLMSYGPSLSDVFRHGASYVDRILKGALPADLPVEQPIKFDLVINQRAAKALALDVPPALLARADKVIE
jgi:putative ABC transport system substrate-binding protein